jgi:hypothetical protein
MRLTTRSRDNDADDLDQGAENAETASSRWVKAGTVCAIGLGATLLACTVIVVTGHHRHDTSTPPAPAYPTTTIDPAIGSEVNSGSPQPGTTDPAASTGAAGTESTGTESAGTGSAGTGSAGVIPADVTWQQVGLGALPFSASAGPRQVTGGVPSGFSDNQPGAVLAATQILGRLSWSATSTADMRAVADAMTTPAAQARAALTYGPPTDPALIPQLAGFQLLTYSPDAALINLALRFHATLRVVPVALSFTGGDWRMSGAPGPLAQSSWAALDDLTGYVLLSGQPTTTGH